MLDLVYASHNSSRRVRRTLTALLGALQPGDWAVNIGSGTTRIHRQVIDIDIYDEPGIDVVTRGQRLPFADNSLQLAVCQEVIEHLQDPAETIHEVLRVLRPGGVFYCQTPFIIGYHSGPNDYWRFTREGLSALFDPVHWELVQLGISVGHGTGFYRIAVEFFAVTMSALSSALYLPTKALMALVLYPMKLFDLLTPFASESNRIPGGYFCVVRKR